MSSLIHPTQLLKQRRFAPLFWTQFFNAFNDNFLKNALIILVEYQSATVWGLPPAEIVALAGGIFILPFFLFSALAGQIADKYEKAHVIRWIKRIEIGIMCLATAGFLFHQPGFLLCVLFAMGLHSTFFGPIKYSILPQHLSNDELVAGNAMVEAGTFVAILLGTIAGGVVFELPHPRWMVSVGLLLIAILGYIVCLWIPNAKAVEPNLKLDFEPIGPSIQMFRFTRKPRSVFWSIMAISWFWFVGAVMLSNFPPLCKEVLNGPPRLVTTYLALFSIGIAVGSLLTARLSRGVLNLRFVAAGFLGISAFAGILWYLSANDPNTILIGVNLFLFSIFGGFFIVPLYTLMQERSEPSQRSRVIAANNILNALFMVAASVSLLLLLRFHFTIAEVMLAVSLANFAMLLFMCWRMPELRLATQQLFRFRRHV